MKIWHVSLATGKQKSELKARIIGVQNQMCELQFFCGLRYYLTFKLRKFEGLFYKINTFTKNTYTYFSILGVTIAVPFLCYFQKLQFVVKKFWTNFCCFVLLMSSKSVSQIFKILFQTGDINIFVLQGVFFSRYVRLKSSFSDEKDISCEIWDTLK